MQPPWASEMHFGMMGFGVTTGVQWEVHPGSRSVPLLLQECSYGHMLDAFNVHPGFPLHHMICVCVPGTLVECI
eukprot:1158743-Pelagomonas_calceolata.AAC.12